MRVGTWNILSGQSPQPGVNAPLADAVRALDLDVLGLNEVDCHWERSGYAYQARDAAQAMGATHWRFAPSFRGPDAARVSTPGILLGPDDEPVGAYYGIALMSRIPVRRWHRLDLGSSPMGLPLLNARNGRRQLSYIPDEPHQAIAAELENGWTIIATHLSFIAPVAIPQLSRLRLWAHHFGHRTVIMGDMNLTRFRIPLRPGWKSVVNESTYPSWRPLVQFDHILVRKGIDASPLALPPSVISDHLPTAATIH